MLKRILTFGFIGAALLMLAACYGKDEKNAGQKPAESTEKKAGAKPENGVEKKTEGEGTSR